MGCSPWGRRESGTTERLTLSGDTDTENRLMDRVQREEGEGGMYGENNKETYYRMKK